MLFSTNKYMKYLYKKLFRVASRGVEDADSSTITNKLGGAFFSNPMARAEFMSIARG